MNHDDLDLSIRAQLDAAGCTCTSPEIEVDLASNLVVISHVEGCRVVRHLMAYTN